MDKENSPPLNIDFEINKEKEAEIDKKNNEDENKNVSKIEIRKNLNLEEPFKANEKSLEIKEISTKLEDKEKIKIDDKDVYFAIKNLEELMLDIDKKTYSNLELSKKIEILEKKIENIHELLENSLLIGKNAVIYYLKKNKNKPIKLETLYRKFGRKIVNEVVIELYERGFIKILR